MSLTQILGKRGRFETASSERRIKMIRCWMSNSGSSGKGKTFDTDSKTDKAKKSKFVPEAKCTNISD